VGRRAGLCASQGPGLKLKRNGARTRARISKPFWLKLTGASCSRSFFCTHPATPWGTCGLCSQAPKIKRENEYIRTVWRTPNSNQPWGTPRPGLGAAIKNRTPIPVILNPNRNPKGRWNEQPQAEPNQSTTEAAWLILNITSLTLDNNSHQFAQPTN
jgi:hypothetical protein